MRLTLIEHSIGFRVYGLAAAALGIVGIVWGDFALVWQPVPVTVPGRTALAYAVGAILFLAGSAIQWRRTSGPSALVLTMLYTLGAVLLHAPRVVAHPARFNTWAGLAEQLALVSGGLVAYASTASIDAALVRRLTEIGQRIFGVCLFSFGLAHFVYFSATASLVPAWLPPGQVFWACVTGFLQWSAGVAILTEVLARAAARLLTAMFIGFGILVHAPAIFADFHSHMNWTANAMNFALVGSAWVIADSIAALGTNEDQSCSVS